MFNLLYILRTGGGGLDPFSVRYMINIILTQKCKIGCLLIKISNELVNGAGFSASAMKPFVSALMIPTISEI